MEFLNGHCWKISSCGEYVSICVEKNLAPCQVSSGGGSIQTVGWGQLGNLPEKGKNALALEILKLFFFFKEILKLF